MTLLVPKDYINLHFGYVAEGDPEVAYTSLGYELTEDVTTNDAFAAAQAISNAWQLSFKDITSTRWAMTGSKVTLGAPSPPYLTVDLTGTTTGEGLVTATPNNCAVLVAKVSETVGRPGKGRMYIPGLDANSVLVSGVFSPGYRVNWQDAVDDFMSVASLVSDNQGPALFHDESSPVTAPSRILTMTVKNQIATQRRRMRP